MHIAMTLDLTGKQGSTQYLRGRSMPREGIFAFVIRPQVSLIGTTILGIAAVLSIFFYVAAVNSIAADGDAIREVEGRRAVLGRERDSLEARFAAAQSPAWLEERSQIQGMVLVGGLRYISGDSALALSRSAR